MTPPTAGHGTGERTATRPARVLAARSVAALAGRIRAITDQVKH